MTNVSIYKDIAARTGGDIYIGIVGPVRTGKSTFIKQFMDKLVLPNISGDYQKERANDELPTDTVKQSARTTAAIILRQNNNDYRAEIHTRKGRADKGG